MKSSGASKRKQEHKERLVQDLTVNSLRGRLIDFCQQLLIHQAIEPKSEVFDFALGVLSLQQVEDIMEERVSLRRCCNLKCSEKVPEEQAKLVIARKIVIQKGGKMVENTNPKMFCGKVRPNDVSECEQAYKY
jgi:hypothetical protein